MILYIGNKLSKHGSTPTSVETLGKLLAEDFDIVSVSDKKCKIIRLLDMLFSIMKYRKKVSLLLIDTYSTSNFYYAFLCGWLAKQMDIPYIPILHGGDLPKRIEKSKKMSNFLFTNAEVNVAPSGYLLEIFEKYGFIVEYIPNSIEIENYLFKKRTQIRPKILYVRAFSKVYNPQMAIRVLTQLSKDYPDIELCMVGPDKDGSLYETESLAKELGVEKYVSFKGKMKKEEWCELAKEYDIFINTTNFDNTPVSVIEAMALGLPVVSTNVGGIPYLLEHEQDSLLVEKNDTDNMVKSIKKLLDDKELALKIIRNGREKVLSFDWKEVKKQWIKLINDVERIQ